jgi:hypothetical protein
LHAPTYDGEGGVPMVIQLETTLAVTAHLLAGGS